jgi:hypothetical protein
MKKQIIFSNLKQRDVLGFKQRTAYAESWHLGTVFAPQS